MEEKNIQIKDKLSGFLSFKPNFLIQALNDCPAKVIGIFTGNQHGKTSTVVKHYIDRILGMCPIEEKNMRPNTPIRTIRFASETLPMEAGTGGEVRNTVYPQLKKFLPYELIKKDITIRKPVMTIKDPQGGRDIFAEFVSYNQEVQSQAGVQRWSVYLDEESKKTFYDEQIPRLLSANGDIIIGMTPVEHICFDEETEILTKRGWKKYNEILMNDIILSYNKSLNCYEWSKIIGFYLNHINEDMFYLKNHNFDFLVTKGHKWVVENIRNINSFDLVEVEKLNTKQRIKRFSEFKIIDDNQNYSDNFIRLVGWSVTDGNFKKGNVRQITIYQSETAYPKHCQEIRNSLLEFGEDYKESKYKYENRIICGKQTNSKGVACHFSINGDLALKIRSVTNSKTINQDFICSLSKRQLGILLDTLIKGDGHKNYNKSMTFSQTENYKLLEDFQLICTLLGLKATIREDKSNFRRYGRKRHIVYVHSNNRYSSGTHVKSLRIGKIKYNGMVWCPHTKNNTVIAKRNNCISISGNTWTFDEIFERADVIYNSPTIIEYFKKKGETLEKKQTIKDNPRIGVIRGATDDNPTLDKDVIDERFSIYDDIDTMEIRRYGVFHQSTGAIFKDFSTNIHRISREEHFSSGMPYDWVHARGIDFHEHTNWACGWIALSKQNEAFIYNEYNPSPDMMVTLEIAKEIALRSKDYHFSINLVDPWMAKKQMNTGLSPIDDLNRAFYEFKRQSLGTGGYWQTWDTKSARGRDIIKERLKNSRLIGRPFANRVINHGEERYLPTLWVLDNCTQTIHSFKNWRWQEWANRESLMTKDEKNKPQDKYSHFPITFECIFKHPAFSAGRFKTQYIKPRESVHAHYFQMR